MKQLIGLFLLLLFSAALGADETRLKVNYTRFRLPNGLEVLCTEDHTIPSISVNMHYSVGSSREKPGKTGFAHLFEHLMFMGSQHVPVGKFDQWLESAGGDNNAFTTEDRTSYFENVPSNALELALFLESDRMGYLLNSMTPEKVNAQRDVVKNERRQSVENQPYGIAEILIPENLFPPEHPYHWSVIGSQEDLSAASHEDVIDFFKTYYSPANAVLCVAGDIDTAHTRALVEKWFADIPRGRTVAPPGIPSALLTREKRLVVEDKVQLPRLYMCWVTPPNFAPGDAEMDLLSMILGKGKNSRLYKRLVYDLQIAQNVEVNQASGRLASRFIIDATARNGHTLGELEKVIQEELDQIRSQSPSGGELDRVLNQTEASFIRRMEELTGRAIQMTNYQMLTGNPDYFQEDLARYRAIGPDDLRSAVQTYLSDQARFIFSIVPVGQKNLAAAVLQEVRQ
jgi:zinc protease